MSDTISSPQAYALAPTSVILDESISTGAKTLYVYLDWRQGVNANAWPSFARMAADLGKSIATIRRWLEELETSGYVTVTPQVGSSHRYSLHHRIERYSQRQEEEATPCKNATPPPAKMQHEHDHLTISDEQEKDTPPSAATPSGFVVEVVTPESPHPLDPLITAGLQELVRDMDQSAASWAAIAGSPHPDAQPPPEDDLAPDTPGTRELFSALARNATRTRSVKKRFSNVSQRDLFLQAEGVLGGELPHLIERAIAARGRSLSGVVTYLDGCRRNTEKRRQEEAAVPGGRDDHAMMDPLDEKYTTGRYAHLFRQTAPT